MVASMLKTSVVATMPRLYPREANAAVAGATAFMTDAAIHEPATVPRAAPTDAEM
jgi:hypothetical protein